MHRHCAPFKASRGGIPTSSHDAARFATHRLLNRADETRPRVSGRKGWNETDGQKLLLVETAERTTIMKVSAIALAILLAVSGSTLVLAQGGAGGSGGGSGGGAGAGGAGAGAGAGGSGAGAGGSGASGGGTGGAGGLSNVERGGQGAGSTSGQTNSVTPDPQHRTPAREGR
jgi:hypothetical protein